MTECRLKGCPASLDVTYPYCREHLKSEMGLVVKKSTIPDAGNGLFWVGIPGKDYIKKGQEVAKYSSPAIQTVEEFHKRYEGKVAEHGLRLSDRTSKQRRKIVLDSVDVMNFPGRYINHRSRPNARFVDNFKWDPDSERFVSTIRATRPIRKNQEVFINYGELFWER